MDTNDAMRRVLTVARCSNPEERLTRAGWRAAVNSPPVNSEMVWYHPEYGFWTQSRALAWLPASPVKIERETDGGQQNV